MKTFITIVQQINTLSNEMDVLPETNMTRKLEICNQIYDIAWNCISDGRTLDMFIKYCVCYHESSNNIDVKDLRVSSWYNMCTNIPSYKISSHDCILILNYVINNITMSGTIRDRLCCVEKYRNITNIWPTVLLISDDYFGNKI